MLSYFRLFAVISFMLVLVGAFFAGMFFKAFTIEQVVKYPLEKDVAAIADFYEQNVWCNYAPIFNPENGEAPLSKKAQGQRKRFSLLSQKLLGTLPYQIVQVYDAKNQPIMTTKDLEMVYFEQESKDDFYLNESLAGNANSYIIQSLGLYLTKDNLLKGSFIKLYQPLSTTRCANKPEKEVNGTLIILTNITHELNKILLFQIIVSLGIVLTFVSLYVALSISSRKAENVINKQHEEKIKLEKEKSRAETQNQQKSMFLANVSHELRTPLNAIIGFSNIIKNESMGPIGHPQYKEYIDDINSSGVHLLSLINDILDYSKAEAHKLEVEFVDMDISKLVTSCLRLVEPRATEAKVKLVAETPETHVVMQADPKRMKQVILNILSNAVKFTPEEGTVSVKLEEDSADFTVKLIFIDSGIGISQKDISRALSPFGQIDSSISRRYEGTGLGLPLTKKLTELMKGTFDIRSEEGLGTTITLTFPLNHEPKNEPLDF